MRDDKDENSITPTATDFPLTAAEPQQGQVTAAADILAAPVGGEKIGTLAAGDPVIVNGTSSDGRRHRILCPDGTTGNCWLDTSAVQLNSLAEEPVLPSGGMPEVGLVVQAGYFCISPQKGIFQSYLVGVNTPGQVTNSCTIASISNGWND